MTGYLLRRIGQAIAVVLLVTIVVFLLLHLLPGGPARAQLGPRATPQQIASFNHAQGYDRSIFVQFWKYLDRLLHGNFGHSYKLNQNVSDLLQNRLPKTLVLTGLATAFAVILAIPMGVVQAVRRNKPLDYAFTALSFVFYATPIFFLGLVLIIVFAVRNTLLPAQAPQTASVAGIFSDFSAMILPIVSIALIILASFSRYMRSSVLDNITEDYVRSARAKGASERRILIGHVLRNALIPIVTLLGVSLPGLFAGALVTEQLFNFPGVGLLFWNAAQTQDYPILLAVVLIIAVVTVIGSLLADIAYAALDPRVRFGGR